MAQLKVRELSPEIGVEVSGVDFSKPLDEATSAELRALFDERGVLVFPDAELDLKTQNRVTYMLIGEPDVDEADRALVQDDGAPRRESYISNRVEGGIAPFGRLLWHSDGMWSDTPFQAISLWGQAVEQPAVPTLFASATYAWDTLPADLRARVEGKHVIHVTGQLDRGGYAEGEVLQATREQELMVSTPIENPHPRTGRSMLYVSEQSTKEIIELPAEESEALLMELFAHLYDPAHVLDYHWRQGDLVIWDNLSVQHGRPDVAVEGPARTLRKTFAPRMVMAETPKFSRM
jgi:alpha-ketoglutarate-dependent taurine dioxygenase